MIYKIKLSLVGIQSFLKKEHTLIMPFVLKQSLVKVNQFLSSLGGESVERQRNVQSQHFISIAEGSSPGLTFTRGPVAH